MLETTRYVSEIPDLFVLISTQILLIESEHSEPRIPQNLFESSQTSENFSFQVFRSGMSDRKWIETGTHNLDFFSHRS